MADASVVDLDADFMRSRRFDLDIFDAQLLAGFPSHGGLADNCLCSEQT